jgi:hypothetical protein
MIGVMYSPSVCRIPMVIMRIAAAAAITRMCRVCRPPV